MPGLVHPIRPSSDMSAFRELRVLIHRWRPDVVHAHSSKAGILARLAAANCHVPTVFTVHGWAFQPSYGWLRRSLALLMERLATSISPGPILCVSHFDRDLAVSHHFPKSRLRVVHNGLRDFQVTPPVSPNEPERVVMVARFAAPKDYETLLRATASVPQIALELIGEGPELNRIRTLATRLGVTKRCHFSGAVEDVPQRLAKAGIFVLSSRAEGLPLSIIEAMRAGLPVVASDVGGIGELVAHGVSGLLVPSSDPSALAVALRRLITDPDLARCMGRAGRQRFLDHFQQHRMVAAVEQAWMDAATASGR